VAYLYFDLARAFVFFLSLLFVWSALRNDFSEARRIAERLGCYFGCLVLLSFRFLLTCYCER
jgi:hypothetical protein